MNDTISSISPGTPSAEHHGSPSPEADHSSAADVYLSISGEQMGPFSLRQALAKIRRNHLDASAWLWRAGMREWLSLGEYLQIRSALTGQHSGRA